MEPTLAALNGRRIAFFHHSADLYGADKVLIELADGVRRYGAEPVVLLPGHGPLTEALARRAIEYHVAAVLKLSRATLSPLGLIQLLKERCAALAVYDRIFGRRRVDLVHSNTVAVLGGALWARARGVPHLWHIHEIIERPRIAARLLPRLVRNYADQVVCNSNATAEWLCGIEPSLAGVSKVVWNGTRAPQPSAADQHLWQEFRPRGTRRAIGLVGRINRWKGHRLLLEAAERLYEQGRRDFSVVFVGSAPPGQEQFLQALQERINCSPLAHRIVLRGFHHDVWQAYLALDIVCVPSIDPEPFGLVAIEAMAMCRPVVAADCGGLAEIIVDGETGLRVPPRDPAALAEALGRLLDDDEERRRMGCAGRTRYLATFALPSMLRAMGASYAAMLEHQGGKQHLSSRR